MDRPRRRNPALKGIFLPLIDDTLAYDPGNPAQSLERLARTDTLIRKKTRVLTRVRNSCMPTEPASICPHTLSQLILSSS